MEQEDPDKTKSLYSSSLIYEGSEEFTKWVSYRGANRKRKEVQETFQEWRKSSKSDQPKATDRYMDMLKKTDASSDSSIHTEKPEQVIAEGSVRSLSSLFSRPSEKTSQFSRSRGPSLLVEEEKLEIQKKFKKEKENAIEAKNALKHSRGSVETVFPKPQETLLVQAESKEIASSPPPIFISTNKDEDYSAHFQLQNIDNSIEINIVQSDNLEFADLANQLDSIKIELDPQIQSIPTSTNFDELMSSLQNHCKEEEVLPSNPHSLQENGAISLEIGDASEHLEKMIKMNSHVNISKRAFQRTRFKTPIPIEEVITATAPLPSEEETLPSFLNIFEKSIENSTLEFSQRESIPWTKGKILIFIFLKKRDEIFLLF